MANMQLGVTEETCLFKHVQARSCHKQLVAVHVSFLLLPSRPTKLSPGEVRLTQLSGSFSLLRWHAPAELRGLRAPIGVGCCVPG